jgi:hypothetical protein
MAIRVIVTEVVHLPHLLHHFTVETAGSLGELAHKDEPTVSVLQFKKNKL